MPELPEVEIVRRGLEPVLVGARLERVEQRRPDLRFPLPKGFARRLEGRTVQHLGRRAKYLLARLSDGNVLVMHLGMTGRFSASGSVSPPPAAREVPPPLCGRLGGGDSKTPKVECPPTPTLPTRGREPVSSPGEFVYDASADPRHDHIVFHLSNGANLTYNDPRRFGFMLLIKEAELERHALFKDLGAEPLGNELTPAYLARRAVGKTVSLKVFLTDQRIVAGLGNIYAAEALYRARLSPARGAATLAKANGEPSALAERLVPAIRAVLQDAIAAGGSTLRDYRQTDGTVGQFQHSFAVYGREGEPCTRPGCRGMVRRSVQGGRSTFFCSVCQR